MSGGAHRLENANVSRGAATGLPQRKDDRDPLTGEAAQWWWLYPLDTLTVEFEGAALALLHLVGPDSGVLCVDIDDGARVAHVNTCDQWCYYWRQAITLLVEGLPLGRHTARIRVLDAPPEHRILKKPVTDAYTADPQMGRSPKLWAMYYLVMR